MADKLQELREGLAAAVATIPGLQVSAWRLPNPTPPSADVWPGPVNYHQAMGNGHSNWTLTVRVTVGMVEALGAQRMLDRYMAEEGDLSVKAAIEADSTLGGVCDDATVRSCTGYDQYVRNDGTALLGAEWTVEVMAADR